MHRQHRAVMQEPLFKPIAEASLELLNFKAANGVAEYQMVRDSLVIFYQPGCQREGQTTSCRVSSDDYLLYFCLGDCLTELQDPEVSFDAVMDVLRILSERSESIVYAEERNLSSIGPHSKVAFMVACAHCHETPAVQVNHYSAEKVFRKRLVLFRFAFFHGAGRF